MDRVIIRVAVRFRQSNYAVKPLAVLPEATTSVTEAEVGRVDVELLRPIRMNYLRV